MFAVIAFNLEQKVFVVYMVALNINMDNKVYLLKKVQIIYLKADKASIKVFSKYANFTNIF